MGREKDELTPLERAGAKTADPGARFGAHYPGMRDYRRRRRCWIKGREGKANCFHVMSKKAKKVASTQCSIFAISTLLVSCQNNKEIPAEKDPKNLQQNYVVSDVWAYTEKGLLHDEFVYTIEQTPSVLKQALLSRSGGEELESGTMISPNLDEIYFVVEVASYLASEEVDGGLLIGFSKNRKLVNSDLEPELEVELEHWFGRCELNLDLPDRQPWEPRKTSKMNGVR